MSNHVIHMMSIGPNLIYGWRANPMEAIVDLDNNCMIIEIRALLDLDPKVDDCRYVATIKCERVGNGVKFVTDHSKMRYGYKRQMRKTNEIEIVGDASLFDINLDDEWDRVVFSETARKYLS